MSVTPHIEWLTADRDWWDRQDACATNFAPPHQISSASDIILGNLYNPADASATFESDAKFKYDMPRFVESEPVESPSKSLRLKVTIYWKKRTQFRLAEPR